MELEVLALQIREGAIFEMSLSKPLSVSLRVGLWLIMV